jgi:hypothetical protein
MSLSFLGKVGCEVVAKSVVVGYEVRGITTPSTRRNSFKENMQVLYCSKKEWLRK